MGLVFVELTMRVKESFGVAVEPDDFRVGAGAPEGREREPIYPSVLLTVPLS